ncbi:MAG TPA: hypothetical protein VFN02_02695 [Ktedonobacteraceae bacterium]|nr:hypothetical protein [Ktedonobacteraceae bacterium]
MTISKSSAKGIRAGRGFTPVTSRDEVDAGKATAHPCITGDLQEAAVSIAQHDHIA